MDLGALFQQVTNAISDHSNQQQHTGFDPSGLLSQVTNLFGQHAAATGQDLNTGDQNQGILPASQDPRGDPADQQQGILPASQDPLGDPADQR